MQSALLLFANREHWCTIRIMQMSLAELLATAGSSFVYSSISTDRTGITITGLAFDSRSVQGGNLFFALPGAHADGKRFIAAAVRGGAVAVVYQGELPQGTDTSGAVFIQVPDARRAMAPIAAAFYGNPSEKLAVIGVTGTEGKSSTVSFVWQLLRLTGRKAGFISTVEYSLGGDAIPNPQHQTTPEAPVVQHLLHQMVLNGCQYAVVEASSHGLSDELFRLGHVAFDAGIFMNVTLEHLEFHKTFEKYRSDKANLFRALDRHSHVKNICGKAVCVPAFGIVNAEDKSAAYFAECTEQPVYAFTTLGAAGAAQDLPPVPGGTSLVTARNIVSSEKGVSFTLDGDFACAVKAAVPGAFNIYNITAALIAVGVLTGIGARQMVLFAARLSAVKGRMTAVQCGQPFEVIVDYAHTPSSFQTIFPPIKARARGRIIAVFGSAGERNLEKRPLQGRIAARFCDIIILADEDPRGEEPMALLRQIASGAEEEGLREGEGLFLIPDRKKAVRHALSLAQEDDIVLLLGKSHENSIIYKDYAMPYDELQEARTALREKGYTQ